MIVSCPDPRGKWKKVMSHTRLGYLLMQCKERVALLAVVINLSGHL